MIRIVYDLDDKEIFHDALFCLVYADRPLRNVILRNAPKRKGILSPSLNAVPLTKRFKQSFNAEDLYEVCGKAQRLALLALDGQLVRAAAVVENELKGVVARMERLEPGFLKLNTTA